MHCQYCHQRLSIFKLLSGQPFCSKEHRELYLNTQSKDAIKRLLSSFGEEGESKRPEAPPPPAPVTAPEPPPPVRSTPASSTEVAVVANPASAVEPDPPEASFLPQALSDPRNRAAVLISRTVTQPLSGQVELPVSPAPEPLWPEPATAGDAVEPDLPLAALAPLELDLAPTDPPRPAPRLTAPVEHEEYSPSIVPAPAAPVVVPEESGLFSLPVSEGRATEKPIAAPDPREVAATPGPPALASMETQLASETPAEVLTPPPPAPARAVWPEQQEVTSLPPRLGLAGALRPRSSDPRTPDCSASTRTAARLGQADATRDLPSPLSAPGVANASAVAPLLPDTVELYAPDPLAADPTICSLPSPATLLPVLLFSPPAGTPGTEFELSPWRVAVGAPHLPDIAGAFSNPRHLAGPAVLPTRTAANRLPEFQPAASITGSVLIRVPAEPVPPACFPLTLPLSAEALPSPKPSTRELPFRAPQPDFRPSLPKASEKATLPSRGPVPAPQAKLSTAGERLFQFSAGSGAPSVPVSGLGQQIDVALALPRTNTEPGHPVPAVATTTREVAWLSSINRINGTLLAAPLAWDMTLRLAAPASIPAAGNALGAAGVTWFPTERVAALAVPVPPAWRVPSADPVPTPVQSRLFRTVAGAAPFVLRSSANIRPLWWDHSLRKAEWAGQPATTRLAHLEASRPSPLSLLTAPRALPIRASMAALLHPWQPRLISWNLTQGEAVSAPLFSNTSFGRRVALPQPGRPSVTVALASPAIANPLTVQALPPSGATTKAVPFAAGRVQPASLPVLPGLAPLPLVDPVTALRASGILLDGPMPIASSPTRPASLGWLIDTPVVAALPWTAPSAYAPALGSAGCRGGLAGDAIAPPPAQPQDVPPVSSRQRLARAFSISLRSLFPLRS